MRCPSCTAENTATRRFCAQCGSALPVPCPACGFENESSARFCLTETMLDTGALDPRRELAADLLGELGSDFVAEKGGDVFGFDGQDVNQHRSGTPPRVGLNCLIH
jgi:hypothetical protein